MKRETYEINICPVPASRPRVCRFGTFYQPKYEAFKKELTKWFEDNKGYVFTQAASVKISFDIPMPKSFSKKKRLDVVDSPHTQRPDIDNLIKAVLDSMNGTVISDDSIIWSMTSTKTWRENPCIYIEIKGN
jgi:Holliday junction resolvase RusA-like endonuclease